ncbi:MAG: DUF541 domain-containing protein [Chitinivibrionales bacterium]|nr:DUF541 domain-containing protein [Chitinivibrionales bacterium]MBD3355716.1 DUF541 domain-containing protein [Chitinivibrionales bacterium]
MRSLPILVCLAWHGLVVSVPAQGYYPVSDRSTLQVSGNAEILIEPDRARISMSVSETKPTVTAAKELVDAQVMKIQSALIELGVGRRDINASQLMVHPVRERPRPRKEDEESPSKLKYRVTRRITVTVTDIGKLDEILDRSLTLGTNRVWNVGLYTSKEDSLKLEAAKKASDDAKRKAAALASTFKGQVGKPILIEHEFGGGSGPIRPLTMEARGRGGEEFARGTIAVTATVNAVFEIE